MRTWSGWRDRRRQGRDQMARDVHDELTFHRDMQARDGAQRPSTAVEPQLVRLAERRDRSLGRWRLLREVGFDAADAARRLWRAPGFSLAAIGMLALGLGANTAVFGLANNIFFRPLPFADADRLVRIQEFNTAPDGTLRWYDASAPTLRAALDTGAFASGAALYPTSAGLVVEGSAALHIGVGAIAEGWSRTLGLRPAVGRLFSEEEERLGNGAGVAVISHHLWQTYFGGRGDIVGQTLKFDGGSRDVIGVLPEGFRFPYEIDAWWPRTLSLNERGFFHFARLAPGMTLDEANRRLGILGPSLQHDYPLLMRGLTPRARVMRDVIVQDGDRMVLLLSWAVAVLMLIAGSNVAMLLTTRIVRRQRELALRAALGCGWGRQVRHLMIETTLIFTAGAAGGLLLTWLSRVVLADALPRRMSTQLPMALIAIDWRVVLFTAALAIAAGAAFGLVASWRPARVAGTAAIGASSRSAGSVSWRRTSSVLILLELTMASALTGGAAVLHGALDHLERRDVGFETAHLLTVQFQLTEGRLATPEAHLQLVRELEARLHAAPSVMSIGSSTVNPLCCGDWSTRATPEGPFTRAEDAAVVNWSLVTPGFFETMGIALRRGRVFTDRDSAGMPPVVVVDERLAHRFWPGEDPVGKRVKRGGTDSPDPWMQVVGVVAPIENDANIAESWYVPYLQDPGGRSTDSLHVFARAANPSAAMPVLRTLVGQVDPGLAIINLRTMEEAKLQALDQQRTGASMAVIFALAGAFFSLSGVYSLVAFVVAGETKEMGIRIALGARPRQVMVHVVWRIGRLAIVGASLGAALITFAEPRLTFALGGAPSGFWRVAALLGLGLILAALGAAVLPARRVLRLDPRSALTAQ